MDLRRGSVAIAQHDWCASPAFSAQFTLYLRIRCCASPSRFSCLLCSIASYGFYSTVCRFFVHLFVCVFARSIVAVLLTNVTHLAWSPERAHLAIISGTSKVHFWDRTGVQSVVVDGMCSTHGRNTSQALVNVPAAPFFHPPLQRLRDLDHHLGLRRIHVCTVRPCVSLLLADHSLHALQSSAVESVWQGPRCAVQVQVAHDVHSVSVHICFKMDESFTKQQESAKRRGE